MACVPHSCLKKWLSLILYRQLLRDHQVKFAGYIHPHPLVHRIDLRVQTLDKRKCTPIQAVDNALADLNQEISIMQEAFRVSSGTMIEYGLVISLVVTMIAHFV